jgi:hypothetical protein
MTILAATFLEEIARYQYELLESFGGLTQVARGISALGAVLYLGGLITEQIATAKRLDERALLRPFIILLVILLFPLFRGTIDAILSPIAGATTAMQESAEKAYDAKQAQILRLADEANNTTPVEASFSIEAIGNYIKLIFSRLGVFYIVTGILMVVLQAILKGAIFIMLLLRVINMIILIIFGPLSFAFSAFPVFQDTWKQWLANYINIFMWYPILNIIEAISFKANTFALTEALGFWVALACKDISVAQQYLTTAATVDDFYRGMALSIGISIAGIYAVMQTPQIANMIVQAATGGASQTHGMSRMAIGGLTGVTGVGGRTMGTLGSVAGRSAGTIAKGGLNIAKTGLGLGMMAYQKARGNSKTS